MKDLVQLFSILNFLGLGGLGIFIYYIIKGLRARILALTQLEQEQKKTLIIIQERARESNKLSKDYKKSLSDFQEMGQKLAERRNELVKELEEVNLRKDIELSRLKKLQLEEIEIKQKSFDRIPELEKKLELSIRELRKQLQILSPSLQSRPEVSIESLYKNINKSWLLPELTEIDLTSMKFGEDKEGKDSKNGHPS